MSKESEAYIITGDRKLIIGELIESEEGRGRVNYKFTVTRGKAEKEADIVEILREYQWPQDAIQKGQS